MWLGQRVVELVSLFEYLIFNTFIVPVRASFSMQFPDHVLEAYSYKFFATSPSSYCLYSVNRMIYPVHLVVSRLILSMSAIISGCTPIQKARDTINTAVLPVGICCSFWFPYPLTGLLL